MFENILPTQADTLRHEANVEVQQNVYRRLSFWRSKCISVRMAIRTQFSCEKHGRRHDELGRRSGIRLMICQSYFLCTWHYFIVQ